MGGKVFFRAKQRQRGLDRTGNGFVEPQLLSSLSLKEFLNNKKNLFIKNLLSLRSQRSLS